jgi:N-carbamoylputrescine amidase
VRFGGGEVEGGHPGAGASRTSPRALYTNGADRARPGTPPTSFETGLAEVVRTIAAAAARGARLVCFPECVLKGMRGTGFPVETLGAREHDLALEQVRNAAAARRVHVILPTERPAGTAWQNGAYVISADGPIQGYQTKNQLPAPEEAFFEPGTARRLFHLDGVPIGVVICHEGWRYPETVRWAAVRGAKIVFHPNFCGAPGEPDATAPHWGESYYEKAMACRAGENHVWFASVNFALPVQECATSIVSPEGCCVVAGPLHHAALVLANVDPAEATGFLARRLAPERYRSQI